MLLPQSLHRIARAIFHKHKSIRITSLACLKSYKVFFLKSLLWSGMPHRTGPCHSLQHHLFPLIPHSLDSNHMHQALFCLRTFAFVVPSPRNTPSGDLHNYLLTIKHHFLKSNPCYPNWSCTPSPLHSPIFCHLPIAYLYPKFSYWFDMFIFYLPSVRMSAL